VLADTLSRVLEIQEECAERLQKDTGEGTPVAVEIAGFVTPPRR
jgi:hypothetical protein